MTVQQASRRHTADGTPGLMSLFLMSAMGPAQIGPYDAPTAAVPDEQCTRCGSARSAHQVVRDEHLTWSCCPPVCGDPRA